MKRRYIGAGVFAAAVAVACLAAVPSTTSRADFTGNGSTTAFAFTFRADAASWVEVFLGGVKQSSGYTVSLNADQASSPGGTVTFLATPAAGATIRIQRTVPLTQDTTWSTAGPFRAKTLEGALDRLAMQDQQLERGIADLADGVEGVQGPPGPVGSVATASDATISGNATVGGTLAVTGASTFTGAVTVPTLTVTSGATFPAPQNLSSGIDWEADKFDDTGTRVYKNAAGVVTFFLKTTMKTGWTSAPYTVLTLPAGCRPPVNLENVIGYSSSTGTQRFTVTTSGAVTVVQAAGLHQLAITISYVAGG